MNKIIKTDNVPSVIGPYSQAVVAGSMLFASGQIGINPKTNQLIDGGIEAQTRQVIENIKAVLKAAGFSIADVVKSTIFLKDMNDFSAVNLIYASLFTERFPARSCVEVALLPKDALIEIEIIAVAKGG